MDKEYIRMLVAGITYNKVERGVYALILQELGGTRRLPIVIGMAEAQSIECKLQEIVTPRPLTHDLMANILRAFGLQLECVVIKQLEGGIFAADLHLSDGSRTIIMDARSSDGVSLAMRMGVPIYVREELLQKLAEGKAEAPHPDSKRANTAPQETPNADEAFWVKAAAMPMDELEQLLARFVDEEAYEKAAKLRDIINRRASQNEKR